MFGLAYVAYGHSYPILQRRGLDFDPDQAGAYG
jgi:hypothetical protein